MTVRGILAGAAGEVTILSLTLLFTILLMVALMLLSNATLHLINSVTPWALNILITDDYGPDR